MIFKNIGNKRDLSALAVGNMRITMKTEKKMPGSVRNVLHALAHLNL